MSEHSNEEVVELRRHDDSQQPRVNEVALKFVADLAEERARLSEHFPLCMLLVDEAIDRIYSTGRIPGKEFYADVFKQKPMKITQKVFVPVRQYPKFNFTGKILGPRGNSLRRLQQDTQCKIAIKGRNSIRDQAKEEELRNSGEARYAHLQKDLYLEISTVATPAEGYARVAYALAEIRKYLIPDKNDEVSQEQVRELMEVDPEFAKSFHGSNTEFLRSVIDKKLGFGGNTPKFANSYKRPSYAPEAEAAEEEYVYDPRAPKRPGPIGNEYMRARPAVSTATYKRPPAPVFAVSDKRLRETPPKPYRPSSYSILRKYK